MSWSLDPLLVWALFQRGLGLVLFISFLSLSFQVVPNAGKRAGIGSVARRMAKMREDFPTAKRLLYFPSLLWLNNSDAMLRLVALTGLANAVLVIYGGPYVPYALITCYVCYLSLDLPMGLVFPWDSFLFEATVLALFLPASLPLPHLALVAAPAPAVTWAYRLLMFRLMFGFGKQKFLGSRSKDFAYLRGFLMYQPLLSPIAWYAHKLPLIVLKFCVLLMFIIEIPVPFFAFFPGPWSVACAALTAFLMVGIWMMGNFGYFSLATIFMCLPLLDNITPRQLELSSLFEAGAPIFTNAFLLVHTACSCITFLFNSWLAQSWTLWSFWYRLPPFIQPLFEFLRFIQPFRMLHPYGVFPPNNQPGVKISLLPEITWDGQHWHELQFRFAPSQTTSHAHFIAPHHPRGDQAIIYDTFGLNANSLMSGMVGPWDPYFYATKAPAHEFCQKLLETNTKLATGEASRQHDTPPIAARITTVMLEPTTIAHRRQTGELWKRTYIGPHIPTHEYDPDFWQDAFGEPELWHPESIMWRKRSRFNELMQRARTGKEDPFALAIWDGKLTPADVSLFWDDFVPMLKGVDRATFDSLPSTVQAVRARFDRRQRRVLARMLGRFTLILLARLEPLYLYQGKKPQLKAETYLHLWMVAQHVIAQGKEAYLHALAEPLSCNEQLVTMTNPAGLYVLSVFRFEEMCFEAQKLRLINSISYPHDPEAKRLVAEKQKNANHPAASKGERALVNFGRTVSGFFCVLPDIRQAFLGPAYDRGFPELYPTFRELDSGDIELAQYTYPSADTVLAPDIKSLPQRGPTRTSAGAPRPEPATQS